MDAETLALSRVTELCGKHRQIERVYQTPSQDYHTGFVFKLKSPVPGQNAWDNGYDLEIVCTTDQKVVASTPNRRLIYSRRKAPSVQRNRKKC